VQQDEQRHQVHEEGGDRARVPGQHDHQHQQSAQDQGGTAHDDAQPAGDQHQGDVRGEQVPQSPGPRRSTRAGRGETTKYKDFVAKIGAPATYAQIVSGLGGRGHSW
jgi:hypothetical protein